MTVTSSSTWRATRSPAKGLNISSASMDAWREPKTPSSVRSGRIARRKKRRRSRARCASLSIRSRRHPGAHIYHYAAYEPTALKRLAMRYATMEAELDQLLRERRFVDLYRVVVQSLRASTETYSLKDLEVLYGHERTGDVTTASDSIVEYERWCLTKDNAILDSIAALQ